MSAPAAVRACTAGPRCSLRTEVTDTAGTRLVPALIADDTAPDLCPACSRNLDRAIDELPELYARLALLHLPDLAIRYKDVQISTSKLHPPIPLNEFVDALMRSIEHETGYWAEQTAVETGMVSAGDWSFRWTAMSRPGARLQLACQLLTVRAHEWLRLGPHLYPARSLTADPAFGHDPAELVQLGPILCIERTGAQGAAEVLRLHRIAREALGEIERRQRSHLPCNAPGCGSRLVFQNPASLDWVCQTCGHSQSAPSHLDTLRETVKAAKAAAAEATANAAAVTAEMAAAAAETAA
jgi:ribosomal protein L37AE/L43A